MAGDKGDFYKSLPILGDFAEAVRAESYTPLPLNSVVGFCDVVGSTAAIAEGRYKAVNFVGAGAIAAVSNALGRRPFPFVFGGDGASFAVAGFRRFRRGAGARRNGLVFQRRVRTRPARRDGPGREIRAAGRDVRVARFAASERCDYAMFSGGGMTWFEERAKRGEYALAPAAPDVRPDLLASPAAGASPRRSMAWCSRSSSRRAATIPVIRPSSRRSSGWRSSAPRPDGR